MSDVAEVVPDFSFDAFSHLLPSLERAKLTTADLLALDAADVAKLATIPLREAQRLTQCVVTRLRQTLPDFQPACTVVGTGSDTDAYISLLDETLDTHIGPIRPGYITEITGESGVGKTQLLLTLLLSVQLPRPRGMQRKALYITTESNLQTQRLMELISRHPALASLPLAEQPQLSHILSIKCPDVQSQEHILQYQLPVVVRRQNIGLIIVDSITANYRAELDRLSGQDFAHRSTSLQQTGRVLRRIATECNCAVVVANQVADRFEADKSSLLDRTALFPSSADSDGGDVASSLPTLQLEHQQKWFTGWGDEDHAFANMKTPSLGIIWTNQISCRIAMGKSWSRSRGEASSTTMRAMKLVFAPWNISGELIQFSIRPEGIVVNEPESMRV